LIRVQLQPEPPGFDERVRQPGQRALAAGVEPLPPYWRECLDDLWNAYQGICAYLGVLIPRGTGGPSVDHFAPKSRRRELAYEWANYRLVSMLMNARKGAFEDVLDPFEIQTGWFILDLSTLQVMPHPELDAETRRRVEETISRLGLNDPECIEARELYYDAYVRNDLSIRQLRRWSPFVASELDRQTPRPGSG
jgi:hypothetical protein